MTSTLPSEPILLGELGLNVKVLAEGEGISRRGTQENAPFSGDVIRKMLSNMTPQELVDWYNRYVGRAYLRQADYSPCLHIMDCTKLIVNYENEKYECSGVVLNDEDELERAAEYGAVKLLQHHARLARPDLDWHKDQFVEMGRVCQLVQGMPLAIVLAAGWLELLSLEEITEEISHSLDILESETRDLPERQRSVRAAFDYSWKRLAPPDQRVLEKLSVFRGGFSRRAAALPE